MRAIPYLVRISLALVLSGCIFSGCITGSA
jgi:hypothetical protein